MENPPQKIAYCKVQYLKLLVFSLSSLQINFRLNGQAAENVQAQECDW